MERLTVAQAAEVLGISKEAVRKRIERGSLDAEKQEDGTWIIALQAVTSTQDSDKDLGRVQVLLVELDAARQAYEAQQRENEYLREQLAARTEEVRRRDVLAAQQSQAIQNLTDRQALPDPAERDQKIMEQMRELLARRRPWWKFWG